MKYRFSPLDTPLIFKRLLKESLLFDDWSKMSEKENLDPKNIHIGIITVSDTRAELMKEGRDEDVSGKIIQEKLQEEDITSDRVIIPDDSEKVKKNLEKYLNYSKIDAVITTGGTGLSSRDRTVKVAKNFFDKEFQGFGEILRRKGYEEVGIMGIFTNTTAGLADQKPIFCLPGPPRSVEIGMDLILEGLFEILKHSKQ